MKRNVLKNAWAICLAFITLCSTLTSCDKKDDDKLPSYADFVEFQITRCERVGGVLMVDFTVTNKKDYNLKVTLENQTVTDNTGKNYRTLVWGSDISNSTGIAMNEDPFYGNVSFNLISEGSMSGHLKVYDYDPADRATAVSLQIGVGLESIQLGNNTFIRTNIATTDNRVKEHGVQTNDSKLAYQVTSCTYDDGNVDIAFTVTNNTGQTLKVLRFNEESDRAGYVAYDDMGNNYTAGRGTRFLSLDGEDWRSSIETTVPAGGKLNLVARVTDVRSNASEMSLSFLVTSDDYVCNDNTVRFLSIPIVKE